MRRILVLAAMSMGTSACGVEFLFPIGEEAAPKPPDELDDANDANDDASNEVVDDDDDDEEDNEPPLVCDDSPRLLDAGYLFGAAELPSGEIALASTDGTLLFDPATGDARVLHETHAWRVVVSADRLFALTADERILSFSLASIDDEPLPIVFGDGNMIDLAVSADRLFFTEEVPGRLRSVNFDGDDVSEHLDAEIAHEIAVGDDATYVAGWIGESSPATIARVSAEGNDERFFDASANALEGEDALLGGADINFSGIIALAQDATHVYFSTNTSPGGIARINKETRAWRVLVPLASSFSGELFPHEGSLYFSVNDITDLGYRGRVQRMPLAGGDIETLLDCGPSVRILTIAGGLAYVAMDANGNAPYLTRVAID